MAVDDAALAIGSFIKFADAMLAEQREVMHDLFQVLTIPDLLFLADLRTPGHHAGMLPYSLFIRLIRLTWSTLLTMLSLWKSWRRDRHLTSAKDV